MRIRNLIIISLLALGLLSSIAGGLLYYSTSLKLIEDEVSSHIYSVAESRSDHISSYISQKIILSKALNTRINLNTLFKSYLEKHDVRDLYAMDKTLAASMLSVEKIERISLVDLEGDVILSTDTSYIGKDISDQEFFVNGRTTYSVYLQNDNLDEIFFSGPLMLEDDVIGVGVLVLSTDMLRDIISNRRALGETGEIMVAVQADDAPVFLSKTRFPDETEMLDVNLYVNVPMRQALFGNELIFKDTLDYRNKHVIAVSQYIKEIDVGLVAKIDRDEVIRPYVLSLMLNSAIIGLVILVVTIILGYFLTDRIVGALDKLVEGIHLFGQGNLKHRIIIKTKDEFSELADSFNDMASKLLKFIGERENYSKDLEKKVRQKTIELQNKITQTEKFNKYLVGRELKMIELKKKLDELEKRK